MRREAIPMHDDDQAAFTDADRLAVHELVARYANAIDARDWDRLETVFADAARFTMEGFGGGRREYVGWPAIREMMEHARHPVTHHVTNVEVVRADGGVAEVHSKIAGVGGQGRVGSADYDDLVVWEGEMWRIAERTVSLRAR